jgi:MbtH protein
MTNPFDAQDGTFSVLVNAQGQHSLWPTTADVPRGWAVVHGPADRQSCLDHVTSHWTDMRPRELASRLDAASSTGR